MVKQEFGSNENSKSGTGHRVEGKQHGTQKGMYRPDIVCGEEKDTEDTRQ